MTNTEPTFSDWEVQAQRRRRQSLRNLIALLATFLILANLCLFGEPLAALVTPASVLRRVTDSSAPESLREWAQGVLRDRWVGFVASRGSQADSRVRAIEDEIKSGPMPAWAGAYQVTGNRRLWLAPKSGFVIEPASGGGQRYFGDVEVEANGQLQLHSALDHEGYRQRRPRLNFAVVRWNDQIFMMRQSRIVELANAINSGRAEERMAFWNRRVESTTAILSDELQKYLRETPIDFSVVSVEKLDGANGTWNYRVTVDGGTQAGAFGGMRIWFASTRDSSFALATVNESTAEFDIRSQTITFVPTVGARGSTRPIE